MTDSSQANQSPLKDIPELQTVANRKYLTLGQLGNVLGVTYQTVRRYVVDGKLRAVKVGGSYRVYEDEIRRFLDMGNLEAEYARAAAVMSTNPIE